jgi:hypothetical protein
MLNYTLNNKSLAKVEDIKQYYNENYGVQNVPYLGYGGCLLGWPMEG